VENGKGVPTPTGKLGIWLDSPMIENLAGQGTVKAEFPGKYILYKRFGIDISKEPMLIYPTLHYQNGGLEFNADATTKVPGLMLAGEVSGGVHGANRLMGNSLLDIVVFGRIAGKSAVDFINSGYKDSKLTLEHVDNYHKELDASGIETDRVAPALLPDYTEDHTKERQLTTKYLGNVR
jgi:succinate dehydrogenase / fumarate reductase flavoprotein subunit/L-aspartate oxidase